MTEGGDDETLQDLHDLVGAVAAAEGSAKHSAQRSVLTAVEKVAKWFADGEEHAMVVPIRRRYGCLYILLVYCLASPPPSLPPALSGLCTSDDDGGSSDGGLHYLFLVSTL